MKRSVILGLLCLAACSSPDAVDPQKFEALYRSAKVLERADLLETREFRRALRSLETEISIGEDRATTPGEKGMVRLYRQGAHNLTMAVIRFETILLDTRHGSKTKFPENFGEVEGTGRSLLKAANGCYVSKTCMP